MKDTFLSLISCLIMICILTFKQLSYTHTCIYYIDNELIKEKKKTTLFAYEFLWLKADK